jgi:hypothetical protein
LVPENSAYQPAQAKSAFSSAEVVVRLHLKGDTKSIYALRGEWQVVSREEIAAMAQTVQTCIRSKWKIPENDPPNINAILKVRLRFNADGRLAEPPAVANPKDDPASRAFSETAIKAVRACEPFKLPKDKYETWKNMVLHLDPRD